MKELKKLETLIKKAVTDNKGERIAKHLMRFIYSVGTILYESGHIYKLNNPDASYLMVNYAPVAYSEGTKDLVDFLKNY